MDEKQNSQKPIKRKHQTILSSVFQGCFLILLIALAAWLVLIAWFAGKIFLSGSLIVINNIETMKNTYYAFISDHYLPAIGTFVYYIKVVISHIYHYTSIAMDYLYRVLHQINADLAITNQRLFQEIASMLTGSLEIILSRLLILMMCIPLFITLLFVFIVDGLGQRDIRKFQGSRESTFFFHWIKPLTGKLFFISIFIYMSMPIAISPHLIMVPMILMLSLTVMLSIKSYKKYV